jgi:hypothetical protein
LCLIIHAKSNLQIAGAAAAAAKEKKKSDLMYKKYGLEKVSGKSQIDTGLADQDKRIRRDKGKFIVNNPGVLESELIMLVRAGGKVSIITVVERQ